MISDGEFGFYLKIGKTEKKCSTLLTDIANKLCSSGKFENVVFDCDRIKCVHTTTNHLCYLDLRTNSTVQNLQKVRHILLQDSRSYQIMYVVKSLVNKKSINCMSDGVIDLFILWLTVFFLQQCEIIPRIQYFIKKGTFDFKATFHSNNESKVEALIFEFMEFYKKFDFGRIIRPFFNDTQLSQLATNTSIRIIEPLEGRVITASPSFLMKFKELTSSVSTFYRQNVHDSTHHILEKLMNNNNLFNDTVTVCQEPIMVTIPLKNLPGGFIQVNKSTVALNSILYFNLCILNFIVITERNVAKRTTKGKKFFMLI
jgi:hypothetical protein